MQVSNLEQSNRGFCLAAHSLMVGGGDGTAINTTWSFYFNTCNLCNVLVRHARLKI